MFTVWVFFHAYQSLGCIDLLLGTKEKLVPTQNSELGADDYSITHGIVIKTFVNSNPHITAWSAYNNSNRNLHFETSANKLSDRFNFVKSFRDIMALNRYSVKWDGTSLLEKKLTGHLYFKSVDQFDPTVYQLPITLVFDQHPEATD